MCIRDRFFSCTFCSINFARQHSDHDTTEGDGDEESEFEFFDPKWTRSADKITFLPATHCREQQRRKIKKSKEPSLVWALAKTFGGTFMMGGVFKFLQDFLNFVGPQLLKYVTPITCI